MFDQFRAAYDAKRGASYHALAGDRTNLGRLLSGLSREQVAVLPVLFALYLEDDDPFLDKQGYSLTWFCTKGNGINKYTVRASRGSVPPPSRREQEQTAAMIRLRDNPMRPPNGHR